MPIIVLDRGGQIRISEAEDLGGRERKDFGGEEMCFSFNAFEWQRSGRKREHKRERERESNGIISGRKDEGKNGMESLVKKGGKEENDQKREDRRGRKGKRETASLFHSLTHSFWTWQEVGRENGGKRKKKLVTFSKAAKS